MSADTAAVSAGTMTAKFGIVLMIDMSSSCWCDPPSGPTERPPCDATSFTLRPSLRAPSTTGDGYATLLRIWSTARPGRNIAYVLANTVLPDAASPADMVTRLPSAMPTLKNRSGNSFPNFAVFSESVVSAPSTTRSWFARPSSISDPAYAVRMSVITAPSAGNVSSLLRDRPDLRGSLPHHVQVDPPVYELLAPARVCHAK